MDYDKKNEILFNTGRIYGLHEARVELAEMRQGKNLLSFDMVDKMLLRLIDKKGKE